MKKPRPPCDASFALLLWALVLGPAALALITGNPWFLALYAAVALIFGLA